MNKNLKTRKTRRKPVYPQTDQPLVDDRWYLTTEAAGFLRTPVVVLAIWRCKNLHPELRPTVIGRKVLYRGQFIREFLESHTATVAA